jgi:hypothetical protein
VDDEIKPDIEQAYNVWRYIFFPHHNRKIDMVRERNMRFVHYTSAATAMKIIQERKFWMRNTTTMNDFSEIEHGLECLISVYNDEPGKRFKAAIDEIFPGMAQKVQDHFNAWIPGIKRDTYIACFSEHDDTEDLIGRLSMWRAYGNRGGVALVLNNTAFLSDSDVLGVHTSSVAYLDKESFRQNFIEVADAIEKHKLFVASMSPELVYNLVWHMFRFGIVSTKHPGFAEEREWRAVYTPTLDASVHITTEIECVNGIPQTVQKIPLKNIPEGDLYGLEIPELLNRIIIGPSEYPQALHQAFVHLLDAAGVPDPASKVVVSNIPLR